VFLLLWRLWFSKCAFLRNVASVSSSAFDPGCSLIARFAVSVLGLVALLSTPPFPIATAQAQERVGSTSAMSSRPAVGAVENVLNGSVPSKGMTRALPLEGATGRPDGAAPMGIVANPSEWFSYDSASVSTTTPAHFVATNTADDFVDLTTPGARSHILDGDVRPNGTYSGGHRPGTGFPGKSEFPPGWSDGRILHEISDVATDPAATRIVQGSRTVVTGSRGGVDIRVVIDNTTGEIVTGYPTNLPINP
jgi:Bacterial EndoU nuclease